MNLPGLHLVIVGTAPDDCANDGANTADRGPLQPRQDETRYGAEIVMSDAGGSCAPTSTRPFDWRRTRDAVRVVAGKWTPAVIVELLAGRRRHADLLVALAEVSDKVLTETLRAMERNGLLDRHSTRPWSRSAWTTS